MGWKCIAIHWFVLQRRRLSLCCKTVLYCDLEAARLGLYYRMVLWQGGWLGKICITIQKLYCDSKDSGLLDYVVTQGRDTASQPRTLRWAQAGARSRRWAQAGECSRRWGA